MDYVCRFCPTKGVAGGLFEDLSIIPVVFFCFFRMKFLQDPLLQRDCWLRRHLVLMDGNPSPPRIFHIMEIYIPTQGPLPSPRDYGGE